jgi:peptidoglycan/xylan/chitin deacetylase (PgdA/CDA1 family)
MGLIATLSFDDGGPDDLKVIELLRRLQLPATFYLVVNRVRAMQAEAYAGFEIASHTVTHPNMAAWPLDLMRLELSDSRAWLRAWSDKSPSGVAWPGGGYSPECGVQAAAAGYRYGRGYYVSHGDSRLSGGPWNRSITFKFAHEAWAPTGQDAHLVAHPAAMSLPPFEQTLHAMIDRGYRFLTNAEFYHAI